MKQFNEFFSEKGNVRPAARKEAKEFGVEMVREALETAGVALTVNDSGTFYVIVGEANGRTVYLRLDPVITVDLK